MSDGLEKLPILRAGEHPITHSPPIQPAGLIQHLGSECGDDLRECRRAWLHDVSGKLIRIDNGHAEIGEEVGDGGFAAGDAAGEADDEGLGGLGRGARGSRVAHVMCRLPWCLVVL